MTQDDLSKKLYVDRSMVSKWERGLFIPKYDVILKLSNLFDVSVNELYYGERQNDENKTQVSEVTINIIKDNRRKIKRIVLCGISFIIILFLSFFIYYFVNTYKSIKVYTISGESDTFGIYDGIIVVSKEKSYIQLGSIDKLKAVDINNVRLYYKKGNKDYTIFSNSETSKLLTNNFSHSELFSYNDLKYIRENLFLEIIYDNNKDETLSLSVQKDFTNKSIFSTKDKPMSDNKSLSINNDVPTYIKENFKLNKKEEKYYIQKTKGDTSITQEYYYNAKLYVVEEAKTDEFIHFEYFYPNDISYKTDFGDSSTYTLANKTCTSGKCNQSIIDYFLDKYVSKIDFEK